MISVVVADDQAVVRAGISAFLDAEPDLTVVGQAADGEAAVALVTSLRPDVALMDIRMPGMNGLAATTRITAEVPATRVVVLTTFNLDDYVFAALRAGAAGFLLKDTDPERVIDAVRVAAGGDALLDPVVTRQADRPFRPPARVRPTPARLVRSHPPRDGGAPAGGARPDQRRSRARARPEPRRP